MLYGGFPSLLLLRFGLVGQLANCPGKRVPYGLWLKSLVIRASLQDG